MQVQEDKERFKTGEGNLCVLCMFLNVMKMWALFSYHICMYEIHVNWWYDMWNEFVHAYECMPENEMYVWCMKEIWICMIMKCMHDSWIEITARSSSVNDWWKCMAYDLMKGTVNCYLATDVGGIVLGTYHWGCRWYCLLGSITEVVGVLIDGSVLPRI